MYAIFADGGRQYRGEEGQELGVDYREAEKGAQLTFERVLAVSGGDGLRLGAPTVAGATVQAEVMGVEMGDKVFIQKFRRRKNFRRRTGHRQMFIRVKVNKISV